MKTWIDNKVTEFLPKQIMIYGTFNPDCFAHKMPELPNLPRYCLNLWLNTYLWIFPQQIVENMHYGKYWYASEEQVPVFGAK